MVLYRILSCFKITWKKIIIISVITTLIVMFMVKTGKVPPQWIIAHEVIVPPMGRSLGGQRAIWIGSDGILIEGYPKLIKKYDGYESERSKAYGLYQWNINTQKLTTVIDDLPNKKISPTELCYFDGRFSFWDQAPNQVIYTGTLEKQYVVGTYPEYYHNHYDCKVYNQAEFKKQNGIYATKLREGDGLVQREECKPRDSSDICVHQYISILRTVY